LCARALQTLETIACKQYISMNAWLLINCYQKTSQCVTLCLLFSFFYYASTSGRVARLTLRKMKICPFLSPPVIFLTRAIFVRTRAVSIYAAHILRFAKFVYHEVDCVLMTFRSDRNHWPTSKINGTHS